MLGYAITLVLALVAMYIISKSSQSNIEVEVTMKDYDKYNKLAKEFKNIANKPPHDFKTYRSEEQLHEFYQHKYDSMARIRTEMLELVNDEKEFELYTGYQYTSFQWTKLV